MPSCLKSSGFFHPASLVSVGIQSQACKGAAILEGFSVPGQFANAQTRIPPSYKVFFWPRSGKLLRRAIQAVCEKRDPGDLTTIEDPTALKQIQEQLS